MKGACGDVADSANETAEAKSAVSGKTRLTKELKVYIYIRNEYAIGLSFKCNRRFVEIVFLL